MPCTGAKASKRPGVRQRGTGPFPPSPHDCSKKGRRSSCTRVGRARHPPQREASEAREQRVQSACPYRQSVSNGSVQVTRRERQRKYTGPSVGSGDRVKGQQPFIVRLPHPEPVSTPPVLLGSCGGLIKRCQRLPHTTRRRGGGTRQQWGSLASSPRDPQALTGAKTGPCLPGPGGQGPCCETALPPSPRQAHMGPAEWFNLLN